MQWEQPSIQLDHKMFVHYGIVQLLLGNIGLPGGGINAMRGESNVQGSTDFGLL